MSDIVEDLKKEYEFEIVPSEQAKGVDHLVFKDGRRYRIQYPRFMEIHEACIGAKGNPQHNLFKLALENLHGDNEQSPAIDDNYLDANRGEAMGLWSPLLRELLLQG